MLYALQNLETGEIIRHTVSEHEINCWIKYLGHEFYSQNIKFEELKERTMEKGIICVEVEFKLVRKNYEV